MSSEHRIFSTRVLATLLVISTWLSGCSTSGPVAGPRVEADEAADVAVVEKNVEKKVEEIARPSRPARVETDEELGFTITESIRITNDVREGYGNAARLLQRGEHEAGIRALQAVIAEAPELTAPHIDLGIAQAAMGDFEAAEASLKHALQLTPDHPVAHNELGIVYRRTGRFELARASYEQALAILGDFHFAQRNLGVLCDLFLEDLSCALSNYQAYQRAFPEDQEVNMWIADIQNRMPSAPQEVVR